MFLFGKALADQSSLADLRSARKSATGNRDPKTLPHSTAQSKSGLDTRAATRRHTGSVNLAELESAGKVVSYLDHLFDKIETKPFGESFFSFIFTRSTLWIGFLQLSYTDRLRFVSSPPLLMLGLSNLTESLIQFRIKFSYFENW